MIKKQVLLITILFIAGFSYGQIQSDLLMGLTKATTAEINAASNVEEGSLVYNTTENAVYVYTGSSWNLISQPKVYMGVFTISSPRNKTISGIPFEPSQISFIAHANVESLNLNSDNSVGNNNSGLANSFGSMNGFARNDNGTITQQVIYVGGSGNSINDISRYASSSQCIGIRYGNQNGDNLGITSASMSGFNSDGFTLNVGSHADNLVVIYHAYK